MKKAAVICMILSVFFLVAVFSNFTGAQTMTSTTTVSISARVLEPPPQGGGGSGGGGGGGGGSNISNPDFPLTQAIFTGRSYPGSNVTLLKDAAVAAVTPAGPDANFKISVTNLTAGTYTFSIYATDARGRRSATQSFTAMVTKGVATTVSGIFISPTFALDKQEVKKGDILTMFGQSVPGAKISIFIYSDEMIKATSTDLGGGWLYKFDTSEADKGDHTTKARSAISDDFSHYSRTLSFKVGDKNVAADEQSQNPDIDLNSDERVNIVDFSVLAYWYKRQSFPESVDLNKDGKIDLVDFSIIAYYWTG